MPDTILSAMDAAIKKARQGLGVHGAYVLFQHVSSTRLGPSLQCS